LSSVGRNDREDYVGGLQYAEFYRQHNMFANNHLLSIVKVISPIGILAFIPDPQPLGHTRHLQLMQDPAQERSSLS
jgi:hypothetical protein